MKLRETPGWGAALQEARALYGHAYDDAAFELAGDIQVPGAAAEAHTVLVLEALHLVDTVRRIKRRRRPRLEFDRQRTETNVVRLYVGIDNSGVARAYTLSSEQLSEERQRALRAALYRLTNRPIANDNDPLASDAPGLATRMVHKGRLAQLSVSACRIRNGRWEGSPWT